MLERAHQLLYSKAMNLLRSLGLERQSLKEIVETLQAQRPQEDPLDLDQKPPQDEEGTFNASTFAFIKGKWFSRQISSSAKGTAVDQWSWDSQEMREPFTHDHDLMTQVANAWVKQLAAGYLQSSYRQVLAGGRLIALSKYPKPGVHPICISDALRRLTGRGRLKKCQPYFGQYFQESLLNVIQFGGSIRNGATSSRQTR